MLLFKQKTAYEVRISDWSSDVCSSDLRVRQARLTRKGRAEFAALDRGSRALASRLLDPLGPSQRERLVKAMAEVERLLRASAVALGVADPASPEARACIDASVPELTDPFQRGVDPVRRLSAATSRP